MGWNEVSGEGSGQGKLGYTAFAEGNTIIRIIDEQPFSRWVHWIPYANRSVTCIGKGCPICGVIKDAKDRKEQPKFSSTKRHAMHIINKNTNQLEIMEQGKGFFNQLLDFKNEIGDLRNYDVKVIRKGTTKNDTNYTMIPMPAKDLTEEEGGMCEDKVILADHFKAPTYEQMLMILEGKPFTEIFSSKSEESEMVETE